MQGPRRKETFDCDPSNMFCLFIEIYWSEVEAIWIISGKSLVWYWTNLQLVFFLQYNLTRGENGTVIQYLIKEQSQKL